MVVGANTPQSIVEAPLGELRQARSRQHLWKADGDVREPSEVAAPQVIFQIHRLAPHNAQAALHQLHGTRQRQQTGFAGAGGLCLARCRACTWSPATSAAWVRCCARSCRSRVQTSAPAQAAASKKTAAKAARGLRVEGGAAEDTTKFLNPLCRPSVGGRAPGAREKHVTTLTCGGHGHVTRGFHTPGQGSGFPPRLEIPVEPVLTEGDVVHERPAHSDAFVHIA